MKKIIKISAILALAATVLAGCMKVDELDTNQYSNDKVTLVSFGPNPVMRGGTLTFIGSNLEKVTEVQIPGLDPITEIEVVASGLQSEIRIQIPVEGPEVGAVKLVAGKTELVTKTELTYIEPIVFEDFTPKNALPGDVITLKGDYMNLVTKVEFTGGAVAEVEPVDRHIAKVTVPATAITGVIIVADDNEIPNRIYSEKELVIGDPKVTSISAVWKKGETVTVAGEHLEMIEKVVFAGATVAAEDFTLASDGKKLTFALPATAADGDVVAVSYAGKEFGKKTLTMVVPTSLAATPKPVKAGATLTITGKDLDLVSGIDFDGAADAAFEYASNKITLTVPATAKEGDITLKMDNGASVTTAFILVVPTITSVSPLELYAGDDDLIVVKGKDLDLVVKAVLGGKEVEITAQSESEISLKTSVSSVGGVVGLVLANGTTVESTETVTLNYHALVIVTERPDAQHIGQEVVLKGENFNLVETIYIGTTKVTQYSIRTDNEIRFLMPWCKVGSYEMSFNLYNGDVEVQANPIEVLLEQKITAIWEGDMHIAWSGMDALSWGKFDWTAVKAGTTLIAHFTLDADQEYWQVRFANGSWSALPSTAGLATDGNLPMTAGQTYYALKLTAEDIAALVNEGGLVMTGTNYTLTRLELVTDIPQEKTIWEGEEVLSAWENHDNYGSDQKWVDAGVYAGAEIKIYFTPSADDWIIQLFGPHWEGGLMVAPDGGQQFKAELCPDAAEKGYVSFKLPEEYHPWFATAQGWGGVIILQGQSCTVTAITML